MERRLGRDGRDENSVRTPSVQREESDGSSPGTRPTPNPPRSAPDRKARKLVLLTTVILVGAVFGTWRSYSYSDSLTFMDATVCTDEGLLSLQIPLVRHSRDERMATGWTTYYRGDNMWEAGDGGGKATLRNWMSMLVEVRCEGGMVAGFGYWKGAWQSDSRPGPFVVIFMPIWAAITLTFVLGSVCYLRRMRFRLITMLLGTTLVGSVLWLLMLEAPV